MQNNFTGEISGKNIVITGGSGVIGATLALRLATFGANVAIVDYKKDRGEETARNLSKESGNKVICLNANVLDKKTLIEANDFLKAEFGIADVLINAAGGNNPTAVTKDEFLSTENLDKPDDNFFGLNVEGFQKVFDLNFLGTLLPTMIFAEDMLKKGGSIINVSSMNGFRPLTRIPAYSAAKASINNFTQWLACHFAKVNVRVNAIAPGFLLTNQNRFLLTDEETGELTPRGKKILANTPMERFGEPEEIVGTVIYLMTSLSKFVTGVVIPVDGGFNAYSGV